MPNHKAIDWQIVAPYSDRRGCHSRGRSRRTDTCTKETNTKKTHKKQQQGKSPALLRWRALVITANRFVCVMSCSALVNAGSEE